MRKRYLSFIEKVS